MKRGYIKFSIYSHISNKYMPVCTHMHNIIIKYILICTILEFRGLMHMVFDRYYNDIDNWVIRMEGDMDNINMSDNDNNMLHWCLARCIAA